MKLKQEVFAVGKWNGMPFTRDDLTKIVSSFNSLKEVLKVPLKLGHNEEQPVLDGQPALGWVEGLSVVGDKLVAEFDHVPEIMVEAFNAKRYRSVSVELDFVVKHKGTVYDFVLTAVALLGADMPAVNVLNDLGAYMSRNSNLPRSDYVAGKQASFSSINGNMQETTMTPEEIAAMKQKNAELEAALTTSKADFTALETKAKSEKEESDKRFKAIEDEQKKTKVDDARSKFTAMLEDAVKAEKITPAQRETYTKVLGIDDDEKVLALEEADVKALFAADDDEDEDDKDKDMAKDKDKDKEGAPGTKLTAKAYEHMEKSGSKDFSASLATVMKANPELAAEYVHSNGEMQ